MPRMFKALSAQIYPEPTKQLCACYGRSPGVPGVQPTVSSPSATSTIPCCSVAGLLVSEGFVQLHGPKGRFQPPTGWQHNPTEWGFTYHRSGRAPPQKAQTHPQPTLITAHTHHYPILGWVFGLKLDHMLQARPCTSDHMTQHAMPSTTLHVRPVHHRAAGMALPTPST